MKLINLVKKLLPIIILIAVSGCGGSNSWSNLPSLASGASIALTGFGASSNVTNQQTVQIEGISSSDIGISSIKYKNLANDLEGTATGTTSWSVDITLVEGDNQITFTLNLANGQTMSINTVITYYPAIDFTSPLQFSESVAYVNDSAITVTAMIGSSNTNSPTIELYSINPDETLGNSSETTLADNGVLPDEIQGDGIYTGNFSFSSSDSGSKCFRVTVNDDIGSTYSSEKNCIWMATHYTSANISKSVSLADQVANLYMASTTGTVKAQKSANDAVTLLQNDSDVAVAQATDDGGVWWITNEGILGLHHPSVTEKKSISGRHSGAVVSPVPVQKAAFTPRYYTGSTNHKNHLLNNTKADNENRIKSSKAIIISPYINNPNELAANNFGNSDDYFSVWDTIKNANQCSLVADTEKTNNGSIGVSLDDFKNLDGYGYIHFSTHGDNYYNGLLSLWNDVWGPSDFLLGNLSLVGLYTGIILPTNISGDYDLTGYENDLQAKRIAIGAGGSVVVLPAFFSHYLEKLPNSLISLSACRSMYNNSLANAMLAKGAGAALGFDDYVYSTYAQATTNTILNEMLTNDVTFGDAVAIARATHGSDDSGFGPGGTADLMTTGANDLKLADGGFHNLGFEEGIIDPWTKTGDGRVIAQLASSAPTEGGFMGIISTGLGYTTQSGKISQSGCIADSVTSIGFDWNFYSEEFLEFCNSSFDDQFVVKICESNNGTNTCTTVMQTSVNTLCANTAALSPADVSFDQGDVYSTGWQNHSVDVSAFAGKPVTLELYATDVGDSIYDTAILIDNITLQ